FALSVTTDADKVKAIATREAWHCFDCNRGPFHVIEVWVENEQMVEVCRPNTRPNISPGPNPPISQRGWRRLRLAACASPPRSNSAAARRAGLLCTGAAGVCLSTVLRAST